ncbi:hypothetical protein HQ393_15740 [Chitinibacter bivalviorum]|uniref:Lipoprotein n=1 Tax=Chitinibacter bivalviorum TaxID=2739434 RepID=A0A7H9BMA5_9NEIS|nr:hypothetical protein [Chitinibacter bivalviorum]QLG89582.1 hypothetical protein HQ393_15740 [Chitinibacter bivalviorum]
MRIKLKSIPVVVSLFILSACAIQQSGKNIRIQADSAAIFGTEVAKFNTADGGQGVIRKDLDNRYSMKIGNFQVVSLGSARKVKLIQQKIIGQRTVLLIEAEDTKCSYSYQLFAIAGSSVENWSIGNCSDKPLISGNDEEMIYSFPAGSSKNPRLIRYTYRDEQLFKAIIDLAPEVTPPVKVTPQPGGATPATKAKSSGQPNNQREPSVPTLTPAQTIKATPVSNVTVTTKSSSRPNVTLTPPTTPPNPTGTYGNKNAPVPTRKPIVFSESEEKPVRRIDLTKDSK